MKSTHALSRILGPLGKTLTLTSARRIAGLRADNVAQRRVAWLAAKCNEGTLTRDERIEYESCVYANNFIAVLQAQARQMLATHKKKKG